MSALKVLLVLAAVACIQAQYVEIDLYTGSSCGGTIGASTYYNSGTCVALASVSVMVSISGSSASYMTYSGATCGGTATATITAASSGACTSVGKVTWPVSGSFVNSYTYSDTACATTVTGPNAVPANTCVSGFMYQTGHTLTICAGCTSSTSGNCADSGVTSGQCIAATGSSGSVKYVFNAATRVPPVAALVAALAACAVAVSKLL